jgi:ABC-type transport system substrate-binding protein
MNPSAGSTRHAFIPGGAQNRANFSDPAVTEMLSRARTTMDPTERGDIYREVQAIVADTLAYTNIFWRVFGIVADQHLGGIALNPDPAAHDFRNIFLRVDG